jgi:hypothetical protein
LAKSLPAAPVIVSGILFWYPLAGVTYQFLHYLIGLRRLGYDPYYVEDSGRWIYDPRINDLSPDPTGNLEAIVPVLEAYGFGDRWAFRGRYPLGACYGLNETALNSLYRDSAALLNVTGAQELLDDHGRIGRKIYIESDPFAAQVKAARGDPGTLAALAAHDVLFTFGENLGQADCLVPVTQHRWNATRQPIVTEMWPMVEGKPEAAFNTITTWHNKGKNIIYNGDTWYWTKDREFEKFIALPQCRPEIPFELALRVEPDIEQHLKNHGWQIANSLAISKDVELYRKYIQNSRGEFTVARDQYVRPRTGWFSDRTACYLAAGRPVITQETGFSKFLPTGKGLFGFESMEDILRAVDQIESDYERHCAAAREVANAYFDAGKVLRSLMTRAGF